MPTNRGPEQAYPDPPRSWSRAGILLGTWVAAWAGVLFFGFGLQAVAQAQGEERLPMSGSTASLNLFHEIFVERDLGAAEALLCDTYSGMSPEDITKNYLEWEESNGRTGATIRVNDVTSNEFNVSIDYGPDSEPVIERFTVITQSRDGDDCVDHVSERESGTSPQPTPDDETSAPTLTGHETVSSYFDEIYRNQDAGSAESYQCERYSGLSTSDLLGIYSSHSHEGPGQTQYSLDVTARGSVPGQSDDFAVTVSLDDDEHAFMVVVDATTAQRCILSVVES